MQKGDAMKRTTLFLILTFFLVLSTTSFADECMEGDCDNGIGTGYTEEGKLYSGAWKDGLPHGMGKLIISKDKHLEGKWEKGQLVKDKQDAK